MNQPINDTDIAKAFMCLAANIAVNNYAVEDYVFGNITPDCDIPIDRYLRDLGLNSLSHLLPHDFSDGRAIENGRLQNLDFEASCFELYTEKIDCMFADCPTDNQDTEDDIYHYKFGIYEYLKELYPLFREIMETKIELEVFDILPNISSASEKSIYYSKITELVKAIKIKKLRRGYCADRYIKESRVSHFVSRLVKNDNGHCILSNNDTNSLDYKLSLFSCFRFYGEANAKLFELKMLQWEKPNNAK